MAELEGRITGDASDFLKAGDKASGALDRLVKKGKQTSKSLSSAFAASAEVFAKVAKAIAVTTAGIGALGTAAVFSFSRFQKEFSQVRTLVDESLVDAKKLEEGVRSLSRSYGVELVRSTRAAYQAISAGIEPAEATEFLSSAFRAAAAGGADVFEVTDLLTSVMNAYASAGLSAEKASDILFQTVKAGKTTIGELSAALGRVAPIAVAAGVQFEEVGAAVAALTKGGLSTSEAVTALRGVLLGIIKPADSASEYLSQAGVSAEALKQVGLAGVMQRVRAATQGSAEALGRMFRDAEALLGVTRLAGDGLEEFQDILGQTTSAAGATAEAFAKVESTLSYQFGRIVQTAKDTFLAIGEALAPFVEGFVKPFQGMMESLRLGVERFVEFTQARAERIREAMATIGDSIAAFFSGMFEAVSGTEGIAGLKRAFDLILDRIISGREGIIAFAEQSGATLGKFFAGFLDNFAKADAKLKEMIDRFTEISATLKHADLNLGGMSRSLGQLAGSLSLIAAPFVTFNDLAESSAIKISNLKEDIKDAARWFNSLGISVAEVFGKLVGLEKEPTFAEQLEAAVEARRLAAVPQLAAGSIGSATVPTRQFGGYLPTEGLFRGEPGEFVVRREAAQALGPQLLRALNAMRPVDVGGLTVNFAGTPSSDARTFARTIAPELDRLARRSFRQAQIG